MHFFYVDKVTFIWFVFVSLFIYWEHFLSLVCFIVQQFDLLIFLQSTQYAYFAWIINVLKMKQYCFQKSKYEMWQQIFKKLQINLTSINITLKTAIENLTFLICICYSRIGIYLAISSILIIPVPASSPFKGPSSF